jgi:intracellular sulfur oxidation DsrE/DsrF family protein
LHSARRVFLVALSVLPLAAGPLAPARAAGPNDPVKVVYHLNDGNEQATAAMRNIRNHLSADPTVKIVVVTHAAGINFLLDGATDKNGNLYEPLVQDLVSRGIEFRLCNFTLQTRNIDKGKVIAEAKIVPSGVAEVARLQAKEGYAYLRP